MRLYFGTEEKKKKGSESNRDMDGDEINFERRIY